MKKISRLLLIITFAIAAAAPLLAQEPPTPPPPEQTVPPAQTPPAQAPPTYTPKYHGDPAHSDSESAALGYMRVVMRAQVLYEKKNGHFATALAQLVHTGTFTQRMVATERGDYTVGFKSKKDSYVLTMTPKFLDAQHRSFYAEDDGKIHADDAKPADGDSPVIETHRW